MKISKKDARRFLLYKQGLYGPYRFHGQTGILTYIRQAGCIQYDPVDVCGRNADLTLLARISDYSKADLYDLLYEKRELVDGFDKNMAIYPSADWLYLGAWRQRFALREDEQLRQLLTYREEALHYIGKQQFVDKLLLEEDESIDWGYGSAKKSRALLDYLFYRGDIVIHHKEGARRFFTLRENFFPAEYEMFKNELAMHCWFVKRRIGAVGLLRDKASDAWLGIPDFKSKKRQEAFQALLAQEELIPLQISGLSDTFYILKKDYKLLSELDQIPVKYRLQFIAPLDPLLWDRKLIQLLFDFSYTWEIYTPAVKRKFGHYVLPILYRDELIGRVEFAREAGKLRTQNIWLEPQKKLPKSYFIQSAKRLASLNQAEYVQELKE